MSKTTPYSGHWQREMLIRNLVSHCPVLDVGWLNIAEPRPPHVARPRIWEYNRGDLPGRTKAPS